MSRNNEWMLTASPETIAESVESYGVITFYSNGLTEMQNAKIATDTINNLSRKATSLRTIMCSFNYSDGVYKSITFEIARIVGRMAVIRRRVKYKEIPGMDPVDDEIEEGPLLPADKAQAICDILNS